MPTTDGWEHYRIFILETLKRLEAALGKINEELADNTAEMRVQAAKWGLIGAIIPTLAAIASIYEIMKH